MGIVCGLAHMVKKMIDVIMQSYVIVLWPEFADNNEDLRTL